MHQVKARAHPQVWVEHMETVYRALRRNLPDNQSDEPVTHLYPAPDRNNITDGGNLACGVRCLPSVACVSVTRSRLSDNSSRHHVSRRQPRCGGFIRHGAAGEPIWPDAGFKADEFDELLGKLRHHSAIRLGI